MCKGFVKIPRRIFETKWWHQKRIFSESDAIIDLYQSVDRKNMMTTSRRTLADRWLWDDKRVHRFLSRLEKDGYLSVTKSMSGTVIKILDYGTSAPPSAPPSAPAKNKERPTKPPMDKGDSEDECPTPNEQSAPPSAPPSAPASRAYKNDNIQSCLIEDIENIRIPPNSPPQGDSAKECAAHTFEEFYSAYPLKKDKKAAIKAWIKLSDKEKRDAIEKLPLYIEDCRQCSRNFRYPATYLNGRTWEDEFNTTTIYGKSTNQDHPTDSELVNDTAAAIAAMAAERHARNTAVR
jgi:hypothetical protein